MADKNDTTKAIATEQTQVNTKAANMQLVDEKVLALETESLIEAHATGNLVEFIPAETFEGSKLGYVFCKGDEGLGYYFDKDGLLHQKIGNLLEKIEPKATPQVAAPLVEENIEGETIEVKFTQPKWGMTARMSGGPVQVTKVKDEGEANSIGVKIGDILLEINKISVALNRGPALLELRKGGEAACKFVRPEQSVLDAMQSTDVVVEEQEMEAIGGDLSHGEMKELKAMLGNSKAKSTAVISNQTDVTETVEDGRFKNSATLVFANCKNCTYILENYSMKIYIHNCENFVLTANTKILTSTVEVYKGSNVKLICNTDVGTMQADQVDGLDVLYMNKTSFTMFIWAGCEKVKVGFKEGEDSLETGFTECQKEFPGVELSMERTQFKISTVNGKLAQEKIVRLENGFTTTMREKLAFDAEQEKNMALMAKNLGITIKPGKKGIKTKPNDPCPCSSGKKFKKCCSHGSDYYNEEGLQAEK
eukprot:m.260712 g.260712  ORF g.260712 m.260712 type:complete len:478 (-) comp40440_c0_seq1:41-1474(-)